MTRRANPRWRWRALSPEVVTAMREEFGRARFNQAAKARELGVNVRTIHYHLYQGKHQDRVFI